MAVSLDELLSARFLTPAMRPFVERTLRELPIPPELKRELLVRWAIVARVDLVDDDFAALRGGPTT